MLTDEWIEEQLQICEAASQGPWRDGFDDCSGRIDDEEHSGAYITKRGLYPSSGPPVIISGGDYESIPKGVLKQKDVDFIIAARDNYSLVLKELQDLQASFALYSKAVQAGEQLYLEAHPELGDLTYPDTGKVVAWLVEQIYIGQWAAYDRCV